MYSNCLSSFFCHRFDFTPFVPSLCCICFVVVAATATVAADFAGEYVSAYFLRGIDFDCFQQPRSVRHVVPFHQVGDSGVYMSENITVLITQLQVPLVMPKQCLLFCKSRGIRPRIIRERL